jgi:RNA-directed DNA polymerase
VDNILLRESELTSARSFGTRESERGPTNGSPVDWKQRPASAGAAPRSPIEWHELPWRKLYRNVRRLQMRIVQAMKVGKTRKVRALQVLLTRSLSGKALAVRRVTENQGKKTPGVDGMTWETPAKKAAAIAALTRKGYTPQPCRRLYIQKSNGKRRPLGILTMKDRAMQMLHLLALDPVAETWADPHSYGFRKERSAADAIHQCFNVLWRQTSAPWVLEGDIESCFDKISHKWLRAHIPMDTVLLQKWLTAGYMERGVFSSTEEGTGQGAVLSPVLAKMTLAGLEKTVVAHCHKADKVHVVTYADDFIITAARKELLETEVIPQVQAFLAARGLTLSAAKTRVTPIAAGFDFLGQQLRKYDGQLLIKPSTKRVQGLREKIRGILRTHRQATAGQVIERLNPVLRGWTNYHRHVASKRTFCAIDNVLFEQLWRWAKRRHPHKSRYWIRQKYFQVQGGRHWVFSGQGAEGKTNHLFLAGQVPIKRHVQVRGDANPYDPHWERYFEQRLTQKWAAEKTGVLLHLWLEQQGYCLLCHSLITDETGWHLHHLVPKVAGGQSKLSNLVVLHPTCHFQLHARGLTVTKPGSVTGPQRKA